MGYDYLGMSFQKEGAAGHTARSGFWILFAVCFPDPGGAVRKLVASFQRFAEHAIAVFGAFAVLWLRRTVLSAFLPSYMVQSKATCIRKSLGDADRVAAKNAI